MGRSSRLLVLLLLTACAKPNYQDSPDLQNQTRSANADCDMSFPSEGLCARIDWVRAPRDGQVGQFTLHFHADGSPDLPVTPKRGPSVNLWMPSMGHGSAPVTIKLRSEGVYDVTDVYFIMPGAWEIQVQLLEEDEIVEQAIKPITI